MNDDFVRHFRSLDNARLTVPEPLASSKADVTVAEYEIGSDRIRLYVIRDRMSEPDCPLYLHLHGGYFINGHGDRDLCFGAYIARRLKGIAVSVDYPLSPEARYPAALNACVQAVEWLQNQDVFSFSREKMSIGGYSAGANLAVGTAIRQMQKTGNLPFKAISLQYAALDFVTAGDEKFRRIGREPENDIIPDILTCYLGENTSVQSDYFVSPLFAPEQALSEFPPTQILTAGKDPLRIESEHFAGRLNDAGVKVLLQTFADADHGFMLNFQSEWMSAIEVVASFLATTLRP